MDYPQEILPCSNYKSIDCNLSEHFLIRLTNTDKIEEIVDQETGNVQLQQICSPEERIDDLSCSLLGIYNIPHIRLGFTAEGKAKYMHYCPPDEDIETPTYQADFTNDANRHYWCIPIHKIDGVPFDYTRGNDPFTAVCIVKHTPMRWNYWHFSLRWQTDLGALEDLDEKTRKKVARRIGHSARVALSHLAKVECPDHENLSTNCYCKN